MKYFFCFDDFLSNIIWKNTTKKILKNQYKTIFKKEIENYEEKLLKILINSYERNNADKGIAMIKQLLNPLFEKCLESFIKSLKNLKQKKRK